MAKIKYSMIVSAMSGKLNGSVFARNRGGSYVRNKTTPSNPQTTAQIAVRSRLSGFSQGWRALTQAVRESWTSAAVNFATTNIFGDPVTPTGINLYVRVNGNIENAGGTALTTPPTPAGVFQVPSCTLVANGTTPAFTVDADITGITANDVIVLEATQPLSAGINNANNQFRQIAILPNSTSFPYDAISEYSAKFGNPVTGKKSFVRMKCINKTTGEVSIAVKNNSIAS